MVSLKSSLSACARPPKWRERAGAHFLSSVQVEIFSKRLDKAQSHDSISAFPLQFERL